MVNILALTLIVTGFMIFARFHMKIQESIIKETGCFHAWSRIKLDKFVGTILMLIGAVVLAINSPTIKIAIGKCIYLPGLFHIGVGVILLTVIYTIITNRLYNQAYNRIEESEFSSLSLGKKIQETMESKRQLSRKFNCFYDIVLGLLALVIFLYLTVVILEIPMDESMNQFLLKIMLAAAALLVALKALFLKEVTLINQWLPILYNEDPNLASDELDKIRHYDKQLSRNSKYPIGLGMVIGLVWFIFIIVTYKPTG